MDAFSSISPPLTLNQDPSFEILAHRLKKAQACVDPTLSLPFPQVLCQSTPLPASL